MNRISLVASSLLFFSVFPVNAASFEFNDRAQWAALVTGISTFDGGTGTPVGGADTFNTSAGLAISDLQITAQIGSSYELSRVNPSAAETWYHWGSAPYGPVIRTGLSTASNAINARITFVTPVNAFGFDFGLGGAFGAAGAVTITPQGSTPVNTSSLNNPAWAFYGVVSDTQTFSYVDITVAGADRYLLLDNIARGVYQASTQTDPPPTETPEPGTLLQIGLGISAIGLVARKRVAYARSTN